jgi:hypothetical protein
MDLANANENAAVGCLSNASTDSGTIPLPITSSSWRRRRRSDQDFDDEARTHIAIETDRLIEAGIEPSTAGAARFARSVMSPAPGNASTSAPLVWLEQLARDVRYAWP